MCVHISMLYHPLACLLVSLSVCVSGDRPAGCTGVVVCGGRWPAGALAALPLPCRQTDRQTDRHAQVQTQRSQISKSSMLVPSAVSLITCITSESAVCVCAVPPFSASRPPRDAEPPPYLSHTHTHTSVVSDAYGIYGMGLPEREDWLAPLKKSSLFMCLHSCTLRLLASCWRLSLSCHPQAPQHRKAETAISSSDSSDTSIELSLPPAFLCVGAPQLGSAEGKETHIDLTT